MKKRAEKLFLKRANIRKKECNLFGVAFPL
jgi:hypothetical protein